MVKKIGKSAKIILLSVVSFSIFLILFNLLVAGFSKEIISYINKSGIGGKLEIKKVNRIFLPFYCRFSGIVFYNNEINFKTDYLNIDFSVKNAFLSKPFIKVEIDKPVISVKIDNNNDNKLDIMRYISYLDTVEIKNAVIKSEYKGIISNLNLSKFEYDGDKKNLTYQIIDSTITKDDLSENFTSKFKGQLLKDKLKIENFELKGNSIYIGTNEFILSKNHLNGILNGHMGGKLLKIFYPGLEGEISFVSRIKDNKFSFSFKTERFLIDNASIGLTGQVFGNYPGKLNFKLNLDNIFGYGFFVDGNFDTKTYDITANADFKKPIDIYKGYGWHVYLNDLFVTGNIKKNIFNVKTEVTSEEKYKVSAIASFDYKNLKVYLNDLTGKSETTEITGKAVSDFKSIKITATGKGNGNGEIKKVLNINAELSSNFEFYVDSERLRLKGDYFSDIPQKIYNIDVVKAEGNFDLTYQGIDFFTDADIDEGNLIINGKIDFNNSVSDFDFELNKISLSEILKYFEIDSDVSFPLTGSTKLKIMNDTLISKGEFQVDNKYFDSMFVKYSIKNNKLKIDYLKADNLIFRDLVSLDFDNNEIKGAFKKKFLKIKNFHTLEDVSLFVEGKINSPEFYGNFNLDLDKFGVHKCFLKGDLNKLSIKTKGKHVISNTILDINNKSLTSNINFDKYLIYEKDNLSITGLVNIKSQNLTEIKGTADKIIIKNNSLDFMVSDLEFDSDFRKITNLKAEVENEFVNKFYLNNFTMSDHFIKGIIDFPETSIDYKNADLNVSGNVLLYYNYKDYPKLFGNLDLNGNVEFDKLGLKLPVTRAFINFFEYDIDVEIEGNELDMSYNLKYKAAKYFEPYNSDLNITGNNLFVHSNNTSVSFDMDAYYKYEERTLFSDIYINDLGLGDFNMQSGTSVKFDIPVNMVVNINTKKPVHIKNKFTDSYITTDLKLKIGKDKLEIKGSVSTIKGLINIAGNPFTLKRAYLKFTDNELPYLYIDANGTGQNRSIGLKVFGFLPEYEIELVDRNPENSFSFESNSNILSMHNDKSNTNNTKSSKYLLTELFNGAMISGIVNVAEKSFGINRIGFEQNKYEGDENNYIKIGKSFSDRFEIKYVVATGEDEESSIVGEYLLMDWLRLVVYASVDGGNGAGFTFYGNF
jgi:hypothetical protein